MNPNFGMKSLLLFMLSVISLIVLTLFESSLMGMPIFMERAMSFLFLVVPGIIGVVFGILGIVRKEPKVWMAYLGVLCNTLFALFHTLVISFAG